MTSRLVPDKHNGFAYVPLMHTDEWKIIQTGPMMKVVMCKGRHVLYHFPIILFVFFFQIFHIA